MDQKQLIETINQRGIEWAIAAVVDGSIGYNSPLSAQRVVEAVLRGTTEWGSERCMCCWQGDLVKMTARDFQCFIDREGYDKDGAERLVKHCKLVLKAEETEGVGVSWGFSAAFPALSQ